MTGPDAPDPPAAASLPAPPSLRPRVKVWFETDGGYSFGFGLIAILQAVARTGSIKLAASDLGQSYRHVWGRIKQAEQALGRALVVTHRGGQGSQRSELTATAVTLIDDFLALRSRMVGLMENQEARRRDGDGPVSG